MAGRYTRQLSVHYEIPIFKHVCGYNIQLLMAAFIIIGMLYMCSVIVTFPSRKIID